MSSDIPEMFFILRSSFDFKTVNQYHYKKIEESETTKKEPVPQAPLGEEPLDGMNAREMECARVAIILSNFDGKNPSSLKIVDGFVKTELGLKKFDMIAAFASELSDRQMLLQGSFASIYGGLEGIPIGKQLVLLFNALGDLGQLMMSPNPGPFGDLALAALRFYHLDAGSPKIE